MILTNPPYVNAASMQSLPAEYRHEPEIALAGGADGMDIVRRIIADARQWLTDEGIASISLNPDTVIETWQALAKSSAK